MLLWMFWPRPLRPADGVNQIMHGGKDYFGALAPPSTSTLCHSIGKLYSSPRGELGDCAALQEQEDSFLQAANQHSSTRPTTLNPLQHPFLLNNYNLSTSEERFEDFSCSALATCGFNISAEPDAPPPLAHSHLLPIPELSNERKLRRAHSAASRSLHTGLGEWSIASVTRYEPRSYLALVSDGLWPGG